MKINPFYNKRGIEKQVEYIKYDGMRQIKYPMVY